MSTQAESKAASAVRVEFLKARIAELERAYTSYRHIKAGEAGQRINDMLLNYRNELAREARKAW